MGGKEIKEKIIEILYKQMPYSSHDWGEKTANLILELFSQEKEKLLERIDKMPEIVEMREGKEIKLGWIDKKKLKEEIKKELKRGNAVSCRSS